MYLRGFHGFDDLVPDDRDEDSDNSKEFIQRYIPSSPRPRLLKLRDLQICDDR